MIEINDFRGDLSDISAKTATLDKACRKQRLSHQEFVDVVNEALGEESGRTMSYDEIGLLYRVLDTNSDGWIDINELYRVRSQVSFASSSSEGDMESHHSSFGNKLINL